MMAGAVEPVVTAADAEAAPAAVVMAGAVEPLLTAVVSVSVVSAAVVMREQQRGPVLTAETAVFVDVVAVVMIDATVDAAVAVAEDAWHRVSL